jgi:hypothetical protein
MDNGSGWDRSETCVDARATLVLDCTVPRHGLGCDDSREATARRRAGAVVYATKWPDPAPHTFGFHEIWHLFVMAGSFCHYWALLTYVSNAGAT